MASERLDVAEGGDIGSVVTSRCQNWKFRESPAMTANGVDAAVLERDRREVGR